MELQVLYQTQGILQVEVVEQIHLLDHQLVLVVLVVLVEEVLELQDHKTEQLILEAVVVVVFQVLVKQAALESLLLDTNFKINMYLLTFKINI